MTTELAKETEIVSTTNNDRKGGYGEMEMNENLRIWTYLHISYLLY